MASGRTRITEKMASWILARRCRCITALVPAIRNGQRLPAPVRRAAPVNGWGIGRWCGPTAAPTRSNRTPTGAGEDRCVNAAEGEVDDGRQVGVITPLPFFRWFRSEMGR